MQCYVMCSSRGVDSVNVKIIGVYTKVKMASHMTPYLGKK